MPRKGLWLLTLGLATACGDRSAQRPDNLVLFLLDTTRADHIACYGWDAARTPNIDRLAEEGTLVEQAFAQSSLTPVSAASLLTGRYPFRHGVRGLFALDGRALAPEVTTLAEALGEEGLRTAAFVSARPMQARYGLDRGFEEYGDQMEAQAEVNRARGLSNPNQRRADATTELVLDWLDEHGGERFALLVHYFDAHDPTLVPPRDLLAAQLDFELPPDLDARGNLAGADGAPDWREDPERLAALYDAEITFMDAQIGRVLARLESAGALERTLVVLVGDHGEGLGQHGFWSHGLLFSEQLRVPLVLRGPGIRAGQRLEARVRLVDVAPTVLELFGRRLPGADGTSFLAALRGGREETPRDLYAEVHHASRDHLGRDARMFALVQDDWKYVHRPESGRHELYDLSSDPGETDNLFARGQARALELRKRLRALGALAEYRADAEQMPPEELDALRELGYLGEE